MKRALEVQQLRTDLKYYRKKETYNLAKIHWIIARLKLINPDPDVQSHLSNVFCEDPIGFPEYIT
jgi:hypothetical protein